MKFYGRLSILLFLMPVISYSQQINERGKNVYAWVSFGSCISFSDNFYGLPGLRTSLDCSLHQKVFVEFEWYGLESLEINFSEDQKSNQLLSLDNKSLLLGIGKYQCKSVAIIGYAGISWGIGKDRGGYHYELKPKLDFFSNPSDSVLTKTYEYEHFKYVGIPVHLKFLWTGLFSGFSIDLYDNIHHYTDYGIILSGNIGKIRNPKKAATQEQFRGY